MKFWHHLNFLAVAQLPLGNHLHCYRGARSGVHRQVNDPKATLPKSCHNLVSSDIECLTCRGKQISSIFDAKARGVPLVILLVRLDTVANVRELHQEYQLLGVLKGYVRHQQQGLTFS